MNIENNLANDNVLNTDILTQYTQAIGGQALLGSVDVFAQQYPQYLDDLVTFHQQEDLEGVANQGHKMKGAAGAIGLGRLGDWAHFIQHNESPDWLSNYPKYIEKISASYEADIAVLRRYLLNA